MNLYALFLVCLPLVGLAVEREIPGASVTCHRLGAWLPILDADGVQCKRLIKATVNALAEGDRPLVLEVDRDIAIDATNGRLKALPGGRVEPGMLVSLSFRHQYDAPVQQNGIWRLDGVDDTVTLAAYRSLDRLSSLRLSCRIKLTADCSPEAVILGKGQAIALRLIDGNLAFVHRGLKNGAGHRVDQTLSTITLAPDTWHTVAAVWTGGTVQLLLDGQEVARQEHLTGRLSARSPWRIGGPVDPHFLHGQVSDVEITAPE